MPWINLTLRRGAFTKNVQHAVMAKLTDALMFWEKIPDTPEARKKMMGWVYEVAEDSGYNGGSPHHQDPFYFISLKYACSLVVLTGSPSNTSSGISRRSSCSPKARPLSQKMPTEYGCTSSNSKAKTGVSEDTRIGFATTRVLLIYSGQIGSPNRRAYFCSISS